MIANRDHYNLFTKEKLVSLLVERATKVEELQTKLEYLAGKRDNPDFDNSLVMDASVSLREIAEKVTEEAEASHAVKMAEIGYDAELNHHSMTVETQVNLVRLQVEAAKSQHKACAENYRATADQVKYQYNAVTAKANAYRDQWIAKYSHDTAQTMIRWIVGSVALVTGIYTFFSF